MLTEDLFEQLKEEIEENLSGIFEYYGDVIRYEFDAFHKDIIHTIEHVAYEDHCIVQEWLDDNKEYSDYIITEPEIQDSILYFYIEK